MINLLDLTTTGKITSGFGLRANPTGTGTKQHNGIDITLKNDSIPSVTAGVVTAVGYDSSRGNYVAIKDSNGKTAQYYHMASPSSLKKGDTVTEGQTIGIQGSTGDSTGKHLHFGVHDSSGNYINPSIYLLGGTGLDINSTGSESNYGTTGLDTTGTISITDNILGNIVSPVIKFIAMLLLAVFGAYLFMKAFDIKLKLT